MSICAARDRARGFTLVELLVAATLSGLVLAGVATTALQIARGGVRMNQYAEMGTQSRRGIEQLEGDLKNASAITWNDASDITLTIPTTGGATRQVTYAWTGAAQAFYLVPGASSAATAGRVVLVKDLPARADGSAGLVFSRYDLAGNAATTDAATKRVQVTFYLARSARGMANTTDTAVSAIFVLRNKPAS